MLYFTGNCLCLSSSEFPKTTEICDTTNSFHNKRTKILFKIFIKINNCTFSTSIQNWPTNFVKIKSLQQ